MNRRSILIVLAFSYVLLSSATLMKGIRIEVRDFGPGVEMDRVHQLFETFYTTKPDGIGMGLSISHSIVEAHGGRLWVSPNVPYGTVFQFTLPVEETVAEHGVKTEVGGGKS